VDEAPKLIHGNVFGLYFAHLGVKDTTALLINRHKQSEGRVLVGIGEPSNVRVMADWLATVHARVNPVILRGKH
jgi:alpha/beta superfamily hydrolase